MVDRVQPVARPQERDRGKGRTGRLAADEKTVGAELARRVLEQPGDDRLAVVRARGPRVLGGEPVVDAHGGDVARAGEARVVGVLHLGRADDPRATVDVDVHGIDGVGSCDAHRDLAGRARDRADLDGQDGGGREGSERPVRVAVHLPHLLDVVGVREPERRQQLTDACVDRPRFLDVLLEAARREHVLPLAARSSPAHSAEQHVRRR